MYCPQTITYVVRQGDNLYQLAKYYQTTVPHILSMNPAVDPYNLQIGSRLTICPGENFRMMLGHQNPAASPNPAKQIGLINDMRLKWSQHVYWTRMLLLSIAHRLNDLDAVTSRLMQNPSDIADVFAEYYTPDVAETIAALLTEHLQIGSALITALRDGDHARVDALNREWYANADKMAEAFSSMNPYYEKQAMREMLHDHLKLTTQEVAMRLAGNYPADIKAFDAVETEALAMADAFTSGIIRQFPQMFG
ncbi:MAG: LysM peptidoglycan-binding domain-containing protein [Oscillospiraceae bacterium]|nr:LysM peptidoglycan-binding domain-containing protein [Oscillospiraceae bacterium]